MHKRTILAVVALLTLPGCRGKQVARVELRAAGSAEGRFVPGAAPLLLWADLDGKWQGNKNSKMPVLYRIDVLQGGAPLASLTCDTTQGLTSVCGISSTVGNSRSADCEVKLACKLPKLSPGTEVTLRVTGTPGARIKTLTDMSIIVREE